MSTPPIQYSGPPISANVPWDVRIHLQTIYQKLGNHTQAFSLQQGQIATLKVGTTTTEVVGGGSSGGGASSASGILVNDQSGVTSYTTQTGDNLSLLVLSNASAIAVSLTSEDPPFGLFVANIGSLGQGIATLMPGSGTINGAASLEVLPGYGAVVAFDGSNWWAMTMPTVPVNTPAIASEWLDSYNASTGEFGQTQPAFSDISGQAVASQVPALSELSGQITTSQLPSAGVSGTITLAELTPTGTQGSITVTNGLITAFTNPT